MNLTTTKTVKELAVGVPGATRVFEKAGIDYCCGGYRSLENACADAGVSMTDVVRSLESAKAAHEPGEEPNFLTVTLAEIIDHIVEKHHVFTRVEIQRLRALIEKVHRVHGQNHPEMENIRFLFQTLSAELEQHMMKEENVLFPYITGMEAAIRADRPFRKPPFGTVANPVRMMMVEHDIHLENNILFPRAVDMEGSH